jgi:hypothetical protein
MVRTSSHKMLPGAASINTVLSTLTISAAPPWSLGGACRRRPRRGAEHHGQHRHRQRHRLEVGADWQRRRTEANTRARTAADPKRERVPRRRSSTWIIPSWRRSRRRPCTQWNLTASTSTARSGSNAVKDGLIILPSEPSISSLKNIPEIKTLGLGTVFSGSELDIGWGLQTHLDSLL